MPRPRALLAVLLTLTWCSAAWHADLEALEMLFEHQHHAHGHASHGHNHPPLGEHDEHLPLVARHVTKDDVRADSGAMLWFVALGLLAATLARYLRASGAGDGRPRRETGPPLARVWQFVQRCAAPSAAPPALG